MRVRIGSRRRSLVMERSAKRSFAVNLHIG